MFSRDRAISATADDRRFGGEDKRSSATTPSLIVLEDGPVILQRGEDGSRPEHFREATTEDRYDYRQHTTLIVPSRRSSVLADLRFALTETTQLFAETLLTETWAENTLAPTPLFTGFEAVDLTVSAANPFNPFGIDIGDVRRRLTELPARVQLNTAQSERYVLGLQHQINETRVQVALQASETRGVETRHNVLDGDATRAAVGPGCVAPCVPLNLFGPEGSVTSAMLEPLLRSSRVEGLSRQRSLTFDVDTRFLALDLSSGLELRKETLIVGDDPRYPTAGVIGGSVQGGTNASRDVLEAYAEAHIPLLRSRPGAQLLELQLAGRYSDYERIGNRTTPRFALRYKPTDQLLVRGTVSKGFRAPTLSQLFVGDTTSFTSLNDPCQSAQNVASLPGCRRLSDPSLQQFLTIEGGNASLDAELSDNVTLGTGLRYGST